MCDDPHYVGFNGLKQRCQQLDKVKNKGSLSKKVAWLKRLEKLCGFLAVRMPKMEG